MGIGSSTRAFVGRSDPDHARRPPPIQAALADMPASHVSCQGVPKKAGVVLNDATNTFGEVMISSIATIVTSTAAPWPLIAECGTPTIGHASSLGEILIDDLMIGSDFHRPPAVLPDRPESHRESLKLVEDCCGSLKLVEDWATHQCTTPRGKAPPVGTIEGPSTEGDVPMTEPLVPSSSKLTALGPVLKVEMVLAAQSQLLATPAPLRQRLPPRSCCCGPGVGGLASLMVQRTVRARMAGVADAEEAVAAGGGAWWRQGPVACIRTSPNGGIAPCLHKAQPNCIVEPPQHSIFILPCQ